MYRSNDIYAETFDIFEIKAWNPLSRVPYPFSGKLILVVNFSTIILALRRVQLRPCYWIPEPHDLRRLPDWLGNDKLLRVSQCF